MAYNGAAAVSELVAHDPSLVVGILGGSAGTTRDTFELLHQAEARGRVALFGRKIQRAESQLDLVGLMRPVLRGELTPADAVRAYHDALDKADTAPQPRARRGPGTHRSGAARRMTAIGGDRAGVLCAGSVIVDVGKIIDRYPEPEHLATITQVSLSTGGPALNMAVDLRMLGADGRWASPERSATTRTGSFVLAECERHDIDASRLRIVDGAVTAFTDAMVEADGGRRTFFHHAGANDLFDGARTDVESSTARILHLGAPASTPDGRPPCARRERLVGAARTGPASRAAHESRAGQRRPPRSPTWPGRACHGSTPS